MISIIIRVIVTASFLEINLMIFLMLRSGQQTRVDNLEVLREIRDDARAAVNKADAAEEAAQIAERDAAIAKEDADVAINVAEAQLRVRGELRNPLRPE